MITLSASTFRIKWAGPNSPFIEFGDAHRMHLTKRDVWKIHKELGEFMQFYKEDFTGKNLDLILEEYLDDSIME